MEGAATQKMQMEMEDGLAGTASGVHHRAVALRKIELASVFRGHQLQLAKHRLVFRRSFVQRSEMFPRANENVRGSLRADVLKGEDVIVFIYDLRRNLFRGDIAK